MKTLFIGFVLILLANFSMAQNEKDTIGVSVNDSLNLNLSVQDSSSHPQIGNSSSVEVFTDEQMSEIETALGDLILHEKEGNYISIKEVESKLFVEFTNDLRGHLLFDVPTKDLSEEQFDKLEEIYQEYGIVEPNKNLSKEELEVVGRTGGFKTLGSDYEKGIEILSKVFSDVFEFEKGIVIVIER